MTPGEAASGRSRAAGARRNGSSAGRASAVQASANRSGRPDGTLLGLGHGRYNGIAVVRPDGTGLHYVTSHAYNEYGFAWSPDSRQILYGRENREGIYVIDADGRNDHRVTRDSPRPIGFGALTWSPDGRSIAYDSNRTGSGDIYLIDADGHNKARLTNSPDVDVVPSWVAR